MHFIRARFRENNHIYSSVDCPQWKARCHPIIIIINKKQHGGTARHKNPDMFNKTTRWWLCVTISSSSAVTSSVSAVTREERGRFTPQLLCPHVFPSGARERSVETNVSVVFWGWTQQVTGSWSVWGRHAADYCRSSRNPFCKPQAPQ